MRQAKIFKKTLTLLLLVSLTIIAGGVNQQLCACNADHVVRDVHEETRPDWVEKYHKETRQHITQEFMQNQAWVFNDYLLGFVIPDLMSLSDTLMATGLWQIHAIGTYFDAEQQLETQLLLQSMHAETHKRYRPSAELCQFGSIARPLIATRLDQDIHAISGAESSLARNMRSINTIFSANNVTPATHLLHQTRHCDAAALAGRAGCSLAGDADNDEEVQINADINAAKWLALNDVINLDTPDVRPDIDDKSVLAWGRNLFSSAPTPLLTEADLKNDENYDELMDLRALATKRSVVENSFHNIIALKAAGPESTEEYMPYIRTVLKSLGYPDNVPLLAEEGRMSYYSLLKLLGQSIYRDPQFYVGLYESPENVNRKQVAMLATDLMLTRELYKSELRQEAVLSIWLEKEVMNLQDKVQSQLPWSSREGDLFLQQEALP